MLTKLIYLTLFFLLNSIAHAEEFEIVYLPKDKSISTLMFDRGIEPIYGKRGALNRILELNNLTEAQARKLPLNHPIKLPHFANLGMEKKDSSVEKKIEILEPVSEEKPLSVMQKKSKNSFSADLGYYIYQGKFKNNSKFDAYGGFVKVSYAHILEWENYAFLILPSASLYKFQKISADYLSSYGVDVVGRKLIANKYLGLGLSYHNLFYITGNNQRPDSFQVGIPGVFLEGGHQFPELEFNVKIGANLSGNDNAEKVGTSPFARLLVLKSLNDSFRLRVSTEFEKRTLNSEGQNLFVLSAGMLFEY